MVPVLRGRRSSPRSIPDARGLQGGERIVRSTRQRRRGSRRRTSPTCQRFRSPRGPLAAHCPGRCSVLAAVGFRETPAFSPRFPSRGLIPGEPTRLALVPRFLAVTHQGPDERPFSRCHGVGGPLDAAWTGSPDRRLSADLHRQQHSATPRPQPTASTTGRSSYRVGAPTTRVRSRAPLITVASRWRPRRCPGPGSGSGRSSLMRWTRTSTARNATSPPRPKR